MANNNILNGQTVLSSMYEHLVASELTSTFANKHLLALVEPILGDTGLPLTFMDVSAITNRNNSFVLLGSGDITRLGNQFFDQLNIYSFSSQDMNMNETYIGLTQNLGQRLTTYAHILKHPEKQSGLLYPFITGQGGLANLQFNVLLSMPSFRSLWLDEYPSVSDELSYILQAFNQFKLALYEQALFTHYHPGLNTTFVSQLDFLNWVPGKTRF